MSKKLGVVAIGALALLLTCAGTTWADSATLHINGGAGDPNLILPGSTSFNVIQSSNGAGNIVNLVLLFSVPGVTTLPSGIAGLTSSSGTVGSLSLAGILATSNTCNSTTRDVYSCANVSQTVGLIMNTNQSNNLVNFDAAELLHNGFTPSPDQYGIFEVIITNANLGPSSFITIGFGSIPKGTFVDAFGCDPSTTPTCFAVPFTEAGLTVPEPGTMVLFGTGLLGMAGIGLRRLLGKRS